MASGCKGRHRSPAGRGQALGELRSLRGHRAEINSLAFTADGKALISASDDGTAWLWDVTAYRPTRPETLTPKQLEVLWSDLAGTDAATAYRASVRLVRCGPAAVTFLKTRLRPLTPPDADRVNGLLADLDDNDFTVRERATKELTALEHTAVPSLKKALEGKRSPEVRRRVERLLGDVDNPTASPERLRDLRALVVLERLASPQAVVVLETMAGGASEARITQEAKAALNRIRLCKAATGKH